MNASLVSIIIPTYNRVHLIWETLDSILKQTYQNWECIVIDDGSTDATEEVMNDYLNRDSRIQYHHRPEEHLPGGNGARNYGLSLAKGDYVIFFDSDDLMTEDHIAIKVNAIQTHPVDYVIAKTKFFNSEISLESYYSFNEYPLSIANYLYEKVNWLTYDTLIKSSLAKSIGFNEKLKSGQEYNYHSKLVLKSTRFKFVDSYVTYRRKHEASKRSQIKTKSQQVEDSFYKRFYTYCDIEEQLEKPLRREYLLTCLDYALKSPPIFKKNLYTFSQLTYKEIGWKAIYIFMIYSSQVLFQSPYRFRLALKKALQIA